MGLGVLCLETYWSPDIDDRRTVKGLLEILEQNVDGVVANHRHVADQQDLSAYLDGGPYDRYDVLYIASHGRRGALVDEDGREIPLHWIASRIGKKFSGGVIFLGSCSTANLHPERSRSPSSMPMRARNFLERTGAAALVGYTKDVNWLPAAQMEMLVLGALAEEGPGPTGVWETRPRDILAGIKDDHAPFVRSLGWEFFACNPDGDRTQSRRTMPDGLYDVLTGLFDLARDPALPGGERVRMIQAAARLKTWDRRFGDIVRDRDEFSSVRRAAATALRGLGAAESEKALPGLRKRIAADESDPNRKAVLRSLG